MVQLFQGRLQPLAIREVAPEILFNRHQQANAAVLDSIQNCFGRHPFVLDQGGGECVGACQGIKQSGHFMGPAQCLGQIGSQGDFS